MAIVFPLRSPTPNPILFPPLPPSLAFHLRGVWIINEILDLKPWSTSWSKKSGDGSKFDIKNNKKNYKARRD